SLRNTSDSPLAAAHHSWNGIHRARVSARLPAGPVSPWAREPPCLLAIHCARVDRIAIAPLRVCQAVFRLTRADPRRPQRTYAGCRRLQPELRQPMMKIGRIGIEHLQVEGRWRLPATAHREHDRLCAPY